MEPQNIKQIVIPESTFMSMISKPEEVFIREYQKYNESRAKSLYLQILTELEKTISGNHFAKFANLKTAIDFICNVKNHKTLKHYYENSENPNINTNLVISACKHKNAKILKYLFDKNNNLLNHLYFISGKNLPHIKDDKNHNAFYYAMRSNKLEFLNMLIDNWPNDYFATHQEELDEVLSSAYEELTLKKIPLSEEIICFVENKLINLRFFSNTTGNSAVNDVLHNISERIGLVIENISLLNAYTNKRIDGKFVFIANFIAQNIHVLKRQLKCTYAQLPWEEMEFCLIAFVSQTQTKQKVNLYYQTTLSQSQLLNHLNLFAKSLEGLKGYVQNMDVNKIAVLPKLEREHVIESVLLNCHEFVKLYSDYQQMIDVHTLMKIADSIRFTTLVDPEERKGQLVIRRALEAVGECLKNTLESPNLSKFISEFLLLLAPKNTRNILMDLRNSPTHAHTLSVRTALDETIDVEFFVGLRNDLEVIRNVAKEIIRAKTIDTIELLLQEMSSSEDLDELKEISEMFYNCRLNDICIKFFILLNHNELGTLIEKLSDSIPGQSDREKDVFTKINQILSLDKANSTYIKMEWLDVFSSLYAINAFLINKIDMKGLKDHVNGIIKDFQPEIEPLVLQKITDHLRIIYRSVAARLPIDDHDEIRRFFSEILLFVGFPMDNIRWSDALWVRSNVVEGSSTLMIPSPEQKPLHSGDDERTYKNQLKSKLTELNAILCNNALNGQLTQAFSMYRKDVIIQLNVETLVSDIMSILGCLKTYLINNQLFLDDYSPLLIGKCLRNFLAHDTPLMYALPFDPTLAVFINAKILLEKNITETNEKIGKIIIDDPSTLKHKFDQLLDAVTNQDEMFVALEEGNEEKFNECVKNGADIYAKNIKSLSSLHFAIKGSSFEIVKTLCEKNVKADNILHVAADHGRLDLFNYLFNRFKCPLNDVDNLKKTSLHYAAARGHPEIVEFLLKKNACPLQEDIYGRTPLHYAIECNHVGVVKILLRHNNRTAWMSDYTALHVVAECGGLELAKILLQNNADVNAKNQTNWTPLQAAASSGHLDLVNLFIQNGAYINTRDDNGCTALFGAVQNGSEEIVDFLVKHGAYVDFARNADNFTALHVASNDGHEKIAKILLENHANANATSDEGTTPLHTAALSGSLGVIQLLLQYGANVNVQDKYLTAPLHLASENANINIADFLIKNKANINIENEEEMTPVHLAAAKGDTHMVDLLIKHHCNLNVANIYGNMPLHAAAASGSCGTIETLIKKQTDAINAKNKNGQTPLHIVASNMYSNPIVVLIKNGANINSKDNDGNTPLHLATLAGYKNNVKVLLEHNAEVNVENAKNETPFNIGIETDHKEIMDIFIENGACLKGARFYMFDSE